MTQAAAIPSLSLPRSTEGGRSITAVTLAYLTSAYARSSDTFIRGEVAHLRALGHAVHTFSIRKPAESEVVSDDVRRERDATDYLLAGSRGRLLRAAAKLFFTRPGKAIASLKLAARVGWPGIKGRLWPLMYWIEAAYLADRLRASGVKHLHNHLGEGSAAVAMIAAHLADISFSLTLHGPNEWDQPHDLSLGLKLKRAAFIVCITDFTRSQLCRWTDSADWNKIQVVRCGVGAEFLAAEQTPPPAERRLICVARLSEQKGLLLLIEAAERLAADGAQFELTIVGDGPLRGDIERQISAGGLQNHIRLVGPKSSAEVKAELLRSRALVLPSFAEGLPIVLMEALALGRPVIGTYVAGIPELIEPNVCGWLTPAGSVEKLVDAMRAALAASTAELERMGRAGARRAAEMHDPTKQAAVLSDLMSQAAVDSQKRSASPP